MTEQFQIASSSKRGTTTYKRVYIGNLPNQYDNRISLQKALEQWIQEQIPDISIETIEVNTSGPGKFPHAVLDCGPQANLVIRSLHQQTWQGQRLYVQREKRNTHNHNTKNSDTLKKPGFGGKTWSAPTAPPPTTVEESKPQPHFTPIPVDQATRDVQSVVEEEFKQAMEEGADPINVALASTAAATLLAAMNAFTDESDPTSGHIQEEMSPHLLYEDAVNDVDDRVEEEPFFDEEPSTFQMKPMADLLADFGQADPNWQSKTVDCIEDVATPDKDSPTSQLAPKGKAPIHICLTSFGFSKGAPKRMDGWSYRQPLLPLDCREYPTVPHYLAWQDGLSGAVKRAFQYPPRNHGDSERSSSSSSSSSPQLSLQDFARKIVAPKVWKVLLDAQNEGGHGYASPLEILLYVGSDTGRHRSVVACEWAAIQLRKWLRANANHAIHQPVSVGTFHRDVDGNRQQHYNLKGTTSSSSSSSIKKKVPNHRQESNSQTGKTLKKKQIELAGDW